MLTHWTRDRTRGPKLPLAWVVKRLTRDNAAAIGLHDRGVLAPGYKADINVIDYDRLRRAARRRCSTTCRPAASGWCSAPTATPRRWSRRGHYRDGEATGALPGRLWCAARKGVSTRQSKAREEVSSRPLLYFFWLALAARRVPDPQKGRVGLWVREYFSLPNLASARPGAPYRRPDPFRRQPACRDASRRAAAAHPPPRSTSAGRRADRAGLARALHAERVGLVGTGLLVTVDVGRSRRRAAWRSP